MALRLLAYMVRIWERFSDADKISPLPLIVPAVLAQVPGGWKAATRFSWLFSPNLGFLGDTVPPDCQGSGVLIGLSSGELIHRIGAGRTRKVEGGALGPQLG